MTVLEISVLGCLFADRFSRFQCRQDGVDLCVPAAQVRPALFGEYGEESVSSLRVTARISGDPQGVRDEIEPFHPRYLIAFEAWLHINNSIVRVKFYSKKYINKALSYIFNNIKTDESS